MHKTPGVNAIVKKPMAKPEPLPFRAGTTLLEMTIVLLLVGIVAAVAQPRFSSALSAYRLEAAAQRVRSDLEYARTLARVQSRMTTVRFSTADASHGGSYRFEGVPSPGDTPDGFDADDHETWYEVDLTEEPYRVILQSAPESISFDLYGSPTKSAVIVVALGHRSKSIRVIASSGEMVIE